MLHNSKEMLDFNDSYNNGKCFWGEFGIHELGKVLSNIIAAFKGHVLNWITKI